MYVVNNTSSEQVGDWQNSTRTDNYSRHLLDPSLTTQRKGGTNAVQKQHKSRSYKMHFPSRPREASLHSTNRGFTSLKKGKERTWNFTFKRASG